MHTENAFDPLPNNIEPNNVGANTADRALKFNKPTVVINTGAGSTSDISDEILDIFRTYNFAVPNIHTVESGQLENCLRTAANDGTDLLIIYGGDGSCMAGAVIAREQNIPLIPLPGGTMNLLPKALYGTDNWQEAIKIALSQTKPRWQPAGVMNEKMFFCGAIFGDPIVMSEAREALREKEVFEAVKHVPDIISAISNGQEFEFFADGKSFDKASNVLQVSCPGMNVGATAPDKFELASVPQLSMTSLISVGAIALADDWRSSPDVFVTLAKRINITGQGEFEVLLDGEKQVTCCPISIRIDPKGVLVMAPPQIFES